MNKKVVIITGASSGMGMEAAYCLIEKGCKVYACARRTEMTQPIKERGGEVISLDVRDEASMVNCVNLVLEKEGRIDVLINNAGYGCGGAIEDVPMQEIHNQYEVNVFGLGRMIQLVLPTMRKQHAGRIINVSSMGGRFTTPFIGWYHSTKYAVEAISDALRMEVKEYNIDVVLIEPGMIQTNWGVIASDNIKKYSGETAYQKNADRVAKFYEKRYGSNGKLTEPKKLAEVISHAALTEKPKARYLTGKYAKLLTFFKTISPDNIYQTIVRKFMGMK